MSAATHTGAELRARREALGWSVHEAEHATYTIAGSASFVAAIEEGKWPRSAGEWNYAAALAAEEARRAPAEPVPPAGVTVENFGADIMVRRSDNTTVGYVNLDGWVIILHDRCADPATLEYVAALSRYRAAQHAAGDRQRKLDAVKAAEDAVAKAHDVLADTCLTLAAARKEAGL